MYGLRNRIVHDYGHVDFQIVFDTLKTDVPDLLEIIGSIIKKDSFDDCHFSLIMLCNCDSVDWLLTCQMVLKPSSLAVLMFLGRSSMNTVSSGFIL